VRAIRLLREREPLAEEDLPEPAPGPGEVVVDVRCAGICHSDAHYRSGAGSRVALPLTPGHEVAGVVTAVGEGVTAPCLGDRVALHYLLPDGRMIGKDVDGGWAERIRVPAWNAVPVPAEVPFEQAAVMMCSTATALHALRVAPLAAGERVAILGFGGLGVSALQLARLLGAAHVYAVDPVPEKLRLAEALGAVPAAVDELPPVDVVLDLAGDPATTLAALRRLAPGGRLVIVAINLRSLTIDPRADVLDGERRIVGCSDHTRAEIVELFDLVAGGTLDLSRAVSHTVPLEAAAVGAVLDELERGTPRLRTVIRR
jgi:2-desacetyl-2-hydroxyethyl bacteriochlorophyllide A dehydrogenase